MKIYDEKGQLLESREAKAHHATHENGAGDEIDVTALSGLLADDQHVLDAEVIAVAVAHALATAANDFLVASGNGAYVKKTLAEALTILGKATASGLASLNASSVVVQQPPAHAASKVTSGRFPVDRLPAMTDEKVWKGTGTNVEEVDIPIEIVDTILSDILQHSNDTTRTTISVTYEKLKEIALSTAITNCRVKYDVLVSANNSNECARLYKNGVALGTERCSIAVEWTTFSQDFTSFAAGDLIQVYAKKAVTNVQVRNLRLYYCLAFPVHTSQDP